MFLRKFWVETHIIGDGHQSYPVDMNYIDGIRMILNHSVELKTQEDYLQIKQKNFSFF